jgi:hypothetical protein
MEEHISGLPVARQIEERPPATHLLQPHPCFVNGVIAAYPCAERSEDGDAAPTKCANHHE